MKSMKSRFRFFFFFACGYPIVLAPFVEKAIFASKTTLNKWRASSSCLVPDHRENAFNFSPLSMTLAVSLSYVAFIMLRHVPSILTLLRVFNHKSMLNFV